jgi:hypothetical protein
MSNIYAVLGDMKKGIMRKGTGYFLTKMGPGSNLLNQTLTLTINY